MHEIKLLAEFYKEQPLDKQVLFWIDSQLNIIYASECAIDRMNYQNLSNSQNNRSVFEPLLYKELSYDIEVAQINGSLENVRKIDLLGGGYYWVSISRVFGDDLIFAVYLSELEDTNIAIRVLQKRNHCDDEHKQNCHCVVRKYAEILTPSELQVLELLLDGYSQKLISQKINVSRTTLNRKYCSISKKIFLKVISSKEIRSRLLG